MEIKTPDPERQQLAIKYEGIQRRLTLIEWAITGIILLLLIFSGFSREIAELLKFPQPWASLLYFIILVVVLGIISLPVSYYSSYLLPRRYNLSVQKFASWLSDQAKAGVIALVLGAVLIIFLYWTLDNFPGFWWVITGVFVLLINLLLTRISPTLLISLFFKLKPLDNPELETRLMKLAERVKSNVRGVYTINLSSKATTANAMLGGIGNTRRIILTDTLLQKYSPEEIEVILAHELGHHILRHIPNLILTQSICTFLTFYLVNLGLIYGIAPLGYQSLSDAAAFPYIILLTGIISLILTPVMNAYSRQLETNADKVAIELTGNPEAFITAMTRLMEQNLSVAHPKRWIEVFFYDHPPYFRRIKTAQEYVESRNKEEDD